MEIVIPVPADADSPKFKTTIGSVKYAPEQNAITWTIKSFPGGKEYLMRAHFGLPSVECEDSEGKPPIQVKFEIPYFTTSGIQVSVERPALNVPTFSHAIFGQTKEQTVARIPYTLFAKLVAFFSGLLAGALLKNHRKEWLPSIAMGTIYHAERGLSA